MYEYVCKYNYHIPITSECITDGDCSGSSNSSDTCKSNICHCGTKAKCAGVSDTCTAVWLYGMVCKCGENDECLSSQTCSNGTCNEGKLVPVSKMFLAIGCTFDHIYVPIYYMFRFIIMIYCYQPTTEPLVHTKE